MSDYRDDERSADARATPASVAAATVRDRRLMALACMVIYVAIAAASPARLALEPVGYVEAGVLGIMLIWSSVVDFREHRLPDGLTLAILALALLRAGAIGLAPLTAALVAVTVGFAMLWLAAFAYRRLRQREGLGFGDVKLFAAAAAWVGLEGLASVLLLAALGALAGVALARLLRVDFDAQGHVPFGPAIAVATWFVLWWGPVASGLPQ